MKDRRLGVDLASSSGKEGKLFERVRKKSDVEGESFTKNDLEMKDLYLHQELNPRPLLHGQAPFP